MSSNYSQSSTKEEISNVISDLFDFIDVSSKLESQVNLEVESQSEVEKIFPTAIILHLPISSNITLNSTEFMNYYWSILQNRFFLDQLNEKKEHKKLFLSNSLFLKSIKNKQNKKLNYSIDKINENQRKLDWFEEKNVLISEYQLKNGINLKISDINSVTKSNQVQIKFSIPLLKNQNLSIEQLQLAANTIMEGGSVGNYSKYEIEQLCIENNIGFHVTYDKLLGLVFNIETSITKTSINKLKNIFKVFSFIHSFNLFIFFY